MIKAQKQKFSPRAGTAQVNGQGVYTGEPEAETDVGLMDFLVFPGEHETTGSR